MSLVESNKMSNQTPSQGSLYKKSLSQTLDSEIDKLHPRNKPLVSYKRWSDSLRSPFRGMAHKVLKKTLEWWYEKPIYLHSLPLEEQVENVRRVHGRPQYPSDGDRATEYIWTGDGDWHR